MAAIPLFADDGDADGWRVLYEEDHEAAGLGARLWQGIGSSGPEGEAFAGVTGRTSSSFDGGWHSYELRLGKGDTLRERGYWMYLPLPETGNANMLSFRADIMSDAGIADTGMSFAFLGGKDEKGFSTAWVVSARDGKLFFGTHGRHKAVADIEPHIWYRIELELSGTAEAGEAKGALRVRNSAASGEEVHDVSVSVSDHSLPLRNLKIDRSRSRGHKSGAGIASMYFDNLLLKVH